MRWWIGGRLPTRASPRRSFSISTTPAMSRTAIGSCRCSTRITTSAAFCRSMSTTQPPGRIRAAAGQNARRRRCAPASAAYSHTLEGDAHAFRGDGHYARPEAMQWCEDNGVDYVFGLPASKPLSMKVDEEADAARTERAVLGKDVVRSYTQT